MARSDGVQLVPYEVDEEEAEVVALTAQQAQALRRRQPPLSPWAVVAMQLLAGAVVALLAWAIAGPAAGWSAAYGALLVALPAALFARGLMSQFSSLNAATASFGFFVWQAAKVAVSVALIAAAPKVLPDLNWLALMAGLVVTLEMYWLALLIRPKAKQI